MVKKGEIKKQYQKKPYQKPIIVPEKQMTFMFDGIRKSGATISCRQCSSCHGCR